MSEALPRFAVLDEDGIELGAFDDYHDIYDLVDRAAKYPTWAVVADRLQDEGFLWRGEELYFPGRFDSGSFVAAVRDRVKDNMRWWRKGHPSSETIEEWRSAHRTESSRPPPIKPRTSAATCRTYGQSIAEKR